MTHRERFLAVLNGETPDRMPWVPRLDIWFNYHHNRGTLPSEIATLSLQEVERFLGAGRSARAAKVFTTNYKTVEVKEEYSNDELHRTLVTPVGNVTEVLAKDPDFPESGYTRQSHYIKELSDYKIMEYVVRDTFYEPCYELYPAYDEEIGDEGLPLCIIGDVPMNTIIRDWLGYERGYLELYDSQHEIESLNQVMLEKLSTMHQIILESPATFFLHGMHFDTQMTPPPFFEQYIKPYYQALCPKLTARGKYLAIHQDGDAALLLKLIQEAMIPVVDCFATHPLVSCTLEHAVEAWGKSMVIWGGIPSVLLCENSVSREEFDTYLDDFKRHSAHSRIIAAVSDNVMPETDYERLKELSQFVTAIVPANTHS